MEASDLNLLDRYRHHQDGASFDRLVERHWPMVLKTCRRLLTDAAAAEDAAQETFQRLSRVAAEVQSNLGGWLYRTAQQVSCSLLRSEIRRRRRERWAADRAELPSAPVDDEMLNLVRRGLDRLSGEQRELLVRHFYQCETQAELSQRLGLPTTTMHRRIQAALANLRRLLKDQCVAG